MDEIDTLPLPQKLEKLLRMVAMGRLDAAVKLAEVLTELLGEQVVSPEAPNMVMSSFKSVPATNVDRIIGSAQVYEAPFPATELPSTPKAD